ncbi:hypothetical protein F7734_51505 [Scytonema sp. UIC 10036]|uniref:hypothetical protein n=1 Tax=Scytonema sp. UIC 10036 TaxID=2304196 RepID=UPI0012DA5A69|nr:hypothetical protein [Scytonema sp. UIC 10036]MUH00257.1 hypothetical protein [Scytonema sp. UIC 10036]
MFIASDRYQEVALADTIPFFNINRLLPQSSESYAGILEVARELYRTFTNASGSKYANLPRGKGEGKARIML